MRTGDTENLEHMSVEFLLLRPQSPRHQDILNWGFLHCDQLLLFGRVCQKSNWVEFSTDTALFLIINPRAFRCKHRGFVHQTEWLLLGFALHRLFNLGI
jgi:hypothetical protein